MLYTCVLLLVQARNVKNVSVTAFYTAENEQPVQGWWKQHWTMFCCVHCSMLSRILFSIFTPDCGLIQALKCWTILLTRLNNVDGKTLFNNREQVVTLYLLILHVTLTRVIANTQWTLDWNDNLAAIFEAKLTLNRPSSSVPLFVGAVETICLGMYQDYCV